MADDIVDMVICTDCGIAAANDDYTGMDEADEERVRAALSLRGHIVVGEDYAHYSTLPCDCCGTTLAGHRFKAQEWRAEG